MTNFNLYRSPLFMGVFMKVHLFHSTSRVSQRPDHHLYSQVDWNQVTGGNYAVVDPMDPSNILYLSPRSYISAQKTWISNDVAVIVLATPKDSPSTPHSSDPNLKGSPKKSKRATLIGWGIDTVRDAKGRVWGMFTSPMTKYVNTYVSSKSHRVSSEESESIPQPAIEVNNGNIVDLTLEWGHILHFKLFGLASGRGFRDALNEFAQHVALIYRTQGGLQLTKRLKIYALCVKAFLGKNPYASTEALGCRIRLANGLPKALPPQARAVLRSRPVQSVRLWISLLHYYKAMVVPVPLPDLSGVVSNPVDLPKWIVDDFSLFQVKFWSLFKDVLSRKALPDFTKIIFYSSFRSGPNMRPALAGILPDLFGWILLIGQNQWIPEWVNKHPCKKGDTIKMYVKACIDLCKHVEGLIKDYQKGIYSDELANVPLLSFGKVWGIRSFLSGMILKMIPEIISQISDQTGYNKAAGEYDFMALYLDMEREARGQKAEGPKPTSKKSVPEGVFDWHTKLFAGLDINAPLPDFYHQTPANLADPKWQVGFPIWGVFSHPSGDRNPIELTRLSFLNEPAGKVRVIAIVDWWSQQLLRPLHDWMFELLASLPTDATFSQEGSLFGFAKEVGKEVYSFDLKSATEMIPQTLYTIVLAAIWGEDKASSWMDLLVSRFFSYKYFDPVKKAIVLSGKTRYRRGQPMGALSSWASMAIVHHSVLQYAASKCQMFPFWDYRILGDDIVIGNKAVAMSYLEVCKLLQIPISLPKSLQSSNGFFDFASQILQYMRNFSPISLREELSAYSPSKRIEMALRLVRRGLVDFTKPGWFSAYLKLIVPSTIYKQVVDARKLGKLDAAAKAVLIQTLGNLEIEPSRFGIFGMPRVTIVDSIKAILPTMNIFRTDFKTSLGLGNDKTNEAAREIACEAICYKANFVYKKYLELRPLLLKWKNATSSGARSALIWEELSPDLKFLAKLLTFFPTIEDKLAVYTRWEEKYRRIVKTIQVCSRLRPMPADLLEHTCEATLDELWNTVCQAESELMVKPDMVLGVEPSVAPVNILKPTAREIYSSEKMYARLGVWSGLVELTSSDESLILGIPGLRLSGQSSKLPQQPRTRDNSSR